MTTGEDKNSAPADTYAEVAAKLRLIASQTKSQESKQELTRLAGLYERLAMRAGGKADLLPAPPLAWSTKTRVPWPEAFFSYDTHAVNTHAPSASGVYALWKRDRWVYVGESSDIRQRLLEHLQGDSACISREDPKGFGFELISIADQRMARQLELIRELTPLCNQSPA